jgi:hypothetical protein
MQGKAYRVPLAKTKSKGVLPASKHFLPVQFILATEVTSPHWVTSRPPSKWVLEDLISLVGT